MSSKSNLFYLMNYLLKSLNRVQPEPSNVGNTDESKSPVVESVMIDNQVAYDQIFRSKTRLPRSPSHQGVSAQSTPPPSSSAGFAIQTPSTNEVSSVPAAVAVKPKTSQSVSPPPQVISILYIFIIKISFYKRLIS
jgi:hypothetical protein